MSSRWPVGGFHGAQWVMNSEAEAGCLLAEELRPAGIFPSTMQRSARKPILGDISWIAPVVHIDVIDAEGRVRALWLATDELLDYGRHNWIVQ